RVDAGNDSLRARIRRAKLEKVPYILVVGDEDADGGTVGVNRRGSDEPERGVRVDDFVERLAAEVAERRGRSGGWGEGGGGPPPPGRGPRPPPGPPPCPSS